MKTPPPIWIDTEDALDDLVDTLVLEPRYGLDTEFLRTGPECPELALIQVSWRDQVALIDPLAVEIEPFDRVLQGPGLLIGHALEQDIEILVDAFGEPPARTFDTQIAGTFAGFGQAGLSRLVGNLLGHRLSKAQRRSDWFQRPLSPAQQDYAASDVRHLLALHDHLTTRLEDRDRNDWVVEDCDRLRVQGLATKGPKNAKPSEALRDAVRLRAKELGLPGHVLASSADLAWWTLGTPPAYVRTGWRAEVMADLLAQKDLLVSTED
jgi:ribonuclease D